jgi:5-methylphenazine-1-carboxylate 1-monooxygenase
MKVVIAGAGIGGLTTALMLHARGIHVEVYENAPELRELGVGINILPLAVEQLAIIGLLPDLEQIAVKTQTLHYVTRLGADVWSEPRGIAAGHSLPQLSIHRGHFHALLYRTVRERLGDHSIKTARRFTGYVQDEAGVTVHFVDSLFAAGSETIRADVLICADGIHSVGRKKLYPNEGLPSWNGIAMWRGATLWPSWRDGANMAVAGGFGGKFTFYPIGPVLPDGRQLSNWVVNIPIKDPKVSPPPPGNWSRRVFHSDVLPHARRFKVDGLDIEGMVRATDTILEYPMADRDPLPRWTRGRVTLLGDAAHPMYPVGSNGATQAILDARCLADELASASHPRAALWNYEQIRLPATAAIVAVNRKGGPEGVIDEVERRAPAGFSDIETVMPLIERQAFADQYKSIAQVRVA